MKWYVCPECESTNTNMYRHPLTEIWCADCGFVLSREGENGFVTEELTQHMNERAEMIRKLKGIKDDVERATVLATWVHEGITDKGGDDYINHPLRVSSNVRGDTEKCIAILHDVVEDSEGYKKITLNDLTELGFNIYIVSGVDAVTRRIYEDGSKEDYFDFIRRLCKNDAGRSVKKSDIDDNMNEARLEYLSVKFRNKLETKYTKAREIISHYEIYGNFI